MMQRIGIMGAVQLLGQETMALTQAGTSSTAAVESRTPHMSPSFKAKLAEADQTQKVDFHEDPNVKLSGYLYNFEFEQTFSTMETGEKFGIAGELAPDIFASMASPAFWLATNDKEWMVVNPHIFGEASVTSSITFKFYLIEVTF